MRKSMAVLPYGIYLGTKAGLFSSKDKGYAWHKETAKSDNSNILSIAYNPKEPNYIYGVCVEDLFKTKDSVVNLGRIFLPRIWQKMTMIEKRR